MAQKILVVDDEPLTQRFCQHHLEKAGYQVFIAGNGNEAIEIAMRESPGAIIMDVMMSQMDGLTALRELKKDPILKQIPVIVMTANVSVHDAVRQEAEL